MAAPRRIVVGTSGWSIPRASAADFAGEGTHLERYGRRLRGAEINSCFYRPHAAATYAKWAAATPRAFRFAIKLPKAITHELQLARARVPLERFLDETSGLGGKRGPILVQLPPSFAFDARVAGRFLTLLRARHDGPVVCEPRHATWASGAADALLAQHRVARVAADPAPFPERRRARRMARAGLLPPARLAPHILVAVRRPAPRSLGRCAAPACPKVSRRGACSTTRRRAPRSRTPSSSKACCGPQRDVRGRGRPARGPTLRQRRRGPGGSWPAPWPRSGAPARASATGGGRSRPASSRDRCPARSAGAAPRARDR